MAVLGVRLKPTVAAPLVVEPDSARDLFAGDVACKLDLGATGVFHEADAAFRADARITEPSRAGREREAAAAAVAGKVEGDVDPVGAGLAQGETVETMVERGARGLDGRRRNSDRRRRAV